MTNFHKLDRGRFNFLEKEFNAKVTEIKESSAGEFITYMNKTTAARISLEPLDGGVFVYIVRLREGIMPPYPMFVEQNTVLNWYELRDIAVLKEPSLNVNTELSEPSFGPPEEEISEILKGLAKIVKTHCSDLLNGDFRILKKVDKKIKKDLRKYMHHGTIVFKGKKANRK